MKPTRIALSLLAASSIAFGASACKKEKKDDGAEATAENGAKTVEGTATKTPTADTAAATGEIAYAHLPGDAEIIAHVSFAQARKSALWQKYQAQLAASMAEDLGEFQAACGIDPFAALGSVTLAVNTASEEKSLAIVTGIDRATIEKCAKAVAEKEGETFTIEEDGAIVHYKGADEEGMLAAWIGDEQVIMSSDKADKAWMQERAAGTNGLAKDAKLVALAGKANQSASLWFAGIPGAESPMAEGMGSMPTGDAPTGFYGSLDFNDGFDLNVGLTYAEAAQATKTVTTLQGFVEMGKQQMPPAAKFLDKTAVAANGNDVTIKLALSSADIEEITNLAKGMGLPFAQ